LSTAAGEECDVASLLDMLKTVPDPREPRGRVYPLSFILAVALVATLAGASNFRQIRDHAADMSPSLLRKLGGTWCWFRCRVGYPSERTIRRVLQGVDAAELDRVSGAWLRANARRDADGRLVLALDGKVLKGAWTDENGQFTLFSAMIHREAVPVAQVRVPAGTNEITQVKALLEVAVPDQAPTGPDQRVVITVDAAHTQRETAEYIKNVRGFEYVMTVKGNQPQLLKAVSERCLPRLQNDPDHVVAERARGQIREWSTWITDAAGIDFPGIAQVACIRRNVYTTSGAWIGKEHAWIITSGTADTISAADIHTHVRQHWGIENKVHYPRDTTWREDAQQTYVGNGPQTLASLRNLALGLLRLNGINKIKEATEWIARDRNRALYLLAT
jgi:predicted transposase YbfD/YdcC